jgi:outer membrane protein OmpA-like peptidoglycan-associated protein
MKKTILSLLLLSAATAVTPASANYFSNARLGMNLNIGSAPNPTPAQLPRGVLVKEQATVYTQATEAVVQPPPAAPAALVVAEIPPAPAPPPAIRRYIVFFDFDKSNLSDEARQVIGTAVRAAKDSGMARIVVTGHTDTVGSERYNQALSERRAGAVKAEIMRLGLGAGDIRTVGKGFSEPLLATGAGVREPQNRRAVIELGYNVTAELTPNGE